jgi:uncharacterized integral membrane protein
MLFLLISGLILSLVLAIFIFQNTTPVVVHFLAWSFGGSLALVLLLTLIFGIIISLLVAIPLVIKRARKQAKPHEPKDTKEPTA